MDLTKYPSCCTALIFHNLTYLNLKTPGGLVMFRKQFLDKFERMLAEPESAHNFDFNKWNHYCMVNAILTKSQMDNPAIIEGLETLGFDQSLTVKKHKDGGHLETGDLVIFTASAKTFGEKCLKFIKEDIGTIKWRQSYKSTITRGCRERVYLELSGLKSAFRETNTQYHNMLKDFYIPNELSNRDSLGFRWSISYDPELQGVINNVKRGTKASAKELLPPSVFDESFKRWVRGEYV